MSVSMPLEMKTGHRSLPDRCQEKCHSSPARGIARPQHATAVVASGGTERPLTPVALCRLQSLLHMGRSRHPQPQRKPKLGPTNRSARKTQSMTMMISMHLSGHGCWMDGWICRYNAWIQCVDMWSLYHPACSWRTSCL